MAGRRPRAFRLNDINKDGVLSGTEVRDTGRGRNRNNADRTTQEFSRLDSNGDNRISADEWRYDAIRSRVPTVTTTT